MLPDDPDARRVANQCTTFEEFVTQLVEKGELSLEFTGEDQHILFHGHCHQKSMVGTEPAIRALSLPSNFQVEEVDSGCCGMAGAFGYEVEHYEISTAMAERSLWPAVQNHPKPVIIAAAGVSCRQQIQHGTDRQALHPAEILRAALVT